LIGHSLEARVRLAAAKGELRELLKDYQEKLPSLFIVSQVDLAESLDEASICGEVKDLRIKIEKAAGEKCSRCWNFATTVGESDEHPEVCHRCREALLS